MKCMRIISLFDIEINKDTFVSSLKSGEINFWFGNTFILWGSLDWTSTEFDSLFVERIVGNWTLFRKIQYINRLPAWTIEIQTNSKQLHILQTSTTQPKENQHFTRHENILRHFRTIQLDWNHSQYFDWISNHFSFFLVS